MNVELQTALQVIALRQHDRLFASFDVGAEVKSRRDSQFSNDHVTAEDGGIRVAREPQIRVGS